ncbi:MAG: hypothetical protein AABY22_36790 [Nanoarchaeota archaeon]
MQHKCENWISKNTKRCQKCRRPEWSLSKKNPFKKGEIVTIREPLTYSRRKFVVDYISSKDNFILRFLGGKEKGELIQWFNWWDLKVNKMRQEAKQEVFDDLLKFKVINKSQGEERGYLGEMILYKSNNLIKKLIK